jgi:hypothetical protein
MIRLKPAALIFATLTLVAAPSAFAFYGSVTSVNVIDAGNMAQPMKNYAYLVDNQTTCFGSCSGTVQGYSIHDYLLAVRKFSMPYFSDADIFAISSPSGWSYEILADDTFNLGFGAGTLQWKADNNFSGIAMSANLGGFSYMSPFAAGKGPFLATFGNAETFLGDPAIPLSPNAILAGLGPVNEVPEPASYLLVLAGVAALVARRTVRAAK